MKVIIPRKIKGFRDLRPELNQLKWQIINAASNIYRAYGFEHWDTPILEYADCLGKYLPDSDTVEEGVYTFQNLEKDPVYMADGREMRDEWDHVVMKKHYVTLRYDLTAPLARLYAERLWLKNVKEHIQENKTPLFRRYQFGPVFRFEAKLDPGRFREFWQLDFDSVGTDNPASDAEVCMILADAMEAVGLKRGSYIINVNNRKILKGFLSSLGPDIEKIEQSIMRVIDKADKIGLEGIEEELGEGRIDKSGAQVPGLALNSDIIKKIIGFFERFLSGSKREGILENLEDMKIMGPTWREGIDELSKINHILTYLGFDEERVLFNPTLVRGMAYYTGPIFEVESRQTYIDEKGMERRVGSICGGGRYDDLVKNLLGIKVPATGASIGVDRLAELLTLTKQVPGNAQGPILVIMFDDKLMPEYQKIARDLRENGLDVEVYYGFQRGLKKQLGYADDKNSPVAILLGEDELKKGVVTVRDLRMGKEMASAITDKDEWRSKVQFEISRSELVNKVKAMM
ncbi:MAG: histidine--tRNA ligase [Acidobacteria bacterium]|jgi:histidyl-tRNA synthetase|nr:histidine--tRNA ligase [Acidobacteriota bacterium]